MLSDRIKSRRKELKLTQDYVAKKLNVTYQTISKYENNVNVPDALVVARLATILECTTDYLTCRTDTPHNIVIENENYRGEIDTSTYPHDLTPDNITELFKILENANFDVAALIKRLKSNNK